MTRVTCADSESIDDSRACLFIVHPPLQQRCNNAAARGAQGGSMMRARLAALAGAFKRELAVYRCALRHPRTPLAARLLLGAAVVRPAAVRPDSGFSAGHRPSG